MGRNRDKEEGADETEQGVKRILEALLPCQQEEQANSAV